MAKICDGKILCGPGGDAPLVSDVRVKNDEKYNTASVLLYVEVAGVLKGATKDEGWTELDDGPETVEVPFRIENASNSQYADAARKSLEAFTGVPMPDADDWQKIVFDDHPDYASVVNKPLLRHVGVKDKTTDKGYVNRYFNPVLATRPEKMSFADFKKKYRRVGEPVAAY